MAQILTNATISIIQPSFSMHEETKIGYKVEHETPMIGGSLGSPGKVTRAKIGKAESNDKDTDRYVVVCS